MLFNVRTVLNACLFSSLLIALVCPLLKKTKLLERIGPGWALTILAAILVRVYLPFEFPYTYSAFLEKYWTTIVDFFRFDLLSGTGKFPLWGVLVIVWGIGILCQVCRDIL